MTFSMGISLVCSPSSHASYLLGMVCGVLDDAQSVQEDLHPLLRCEPAVSTALPGELAPPGVQVQAAGDVVVVFHHRAPIEGEAV